MIVVRDREAGNIICEVETEQTALELIKEFEGEDKAMGWFSEDFYEVAELHDKHTKCRKRGK